jgi:hypothetical protein
VRRLSVRWANLRESFGLGLRWRLLSSREGATVQGEIMLLPGFPPATLVSALACVMSSGMGETASVQ